MRHKNQRQDFYFKKAKKQGYPARSVYKLSEIDKKYQLIKEGDFVLDLGSAPGSWLFYLAKKIGKSGAVIGIDLETLKISLPENAKFIKKDVKNIETRDIRDIKDKGDKGDKGDTKDTGDIRERIFDVVVSDLAPKTTGIGFADAENSLELAEYAFFLAKKFLKPDGHLVIKIFEGQETNNFLREIKKHFAFAKPFRPKAVRKASREFYIVAKNFKP